MRPSAVIVALLVATGAGTPSARAGALSKVVHGMQQQSGQSGRGNGAAGDGDDSTDSGDGDATFTDGYAACGGCADDPTAPIVVQGYPPAYPVGPGEQFDLYLGLQSVDDSDYAATASFRATTGAYGAAFSDTSYFERIIRPGGREDTLRLDVWDVTLQYRVMTSGERDETQLWISGGFAGASSDDLEIYGASFGALLTQNLRGALGAEAGLRALRYQDDINGVEWRVGFAASVVRISYRHMKFNVGPALKGPEFGLALHF